MSALLLLAAASAMTAPTVDQDTAREMKRKYPNAIVHSGRSAAASIELSVAPDGKVFKCETLSHVGDDYLAQEGCRFYADQTLAPARDNAGKPTFGRMRTLVKYFLPGQGRSKDIEVLTEGPDAALQVSRLPDGVAGPADIGVALQVDSGGTVAGCEAAITAYQTLGKLACDTMAGKDIGQLRDAAGTAVPYVTMFRVRFAAARAT